MNSLLWPPLGLASSRRLRFLSGAFLVGSAVLNLVAVAYSRGHSPLALDYALLQLFVLAVLSVWRGRAALLSRPRLALATALVELALTLFLVATVSELYLMAGFVAVADVAVLAPGLWNLLPALAMGGAVAAGSALTGSPFGGSLAFGAIFSVAFLAMAYGVRAAERSRQEHDRAQALVVELKAAQEEVRRLAQAAERERIARDLHDLLGHTLTLLVLKGQLLEELVRRDPERAAREARALTEAARSALAEVRAAVADVRAGGALAVLTRDLVRPLEELGIHVELSLPGAVDLPEEEARELLLILREALTNVARHSGARSVAVRLQRGPEGVRLEVQDDGRGLPARRRPGGGLAGMEARAAALGGSLELTTPPDGHGTRLSVLLPTASTSDHPSPLGGTA
jgi:signal transduction histidine kinase